MCPAIILLSVNYILNLMAMPPAACITVADDEPKRPGLFQYPFDFRENFDKFCNVCFRRFFKSDLSAHAVIPQSDDLKMASGLFFG